MAGSAAINPALVTDLEMMSSICGSSFNIGAKRLISSAKAWLCDSRAEQMRTVEETITPSRQSGLFLPPSPCTVSLQLQQQAEHGGLGELWRAGT